MQNENDTDVVTEDSSLKDIEKEARPSVDKMKSFVVDVGGSDEPVDNRDYVEQMFKDFIPGRGTMNKKIHGHMCDGNEVPKIPKGAMAVLFNYRTKRTQGRRDPLAGNHVLVIPTEKEPIMIPLHLVKKFALNLLKIMDGVEDICAEKDIDLNPPGVDK